MTLNLKTTCTAALITALVSTSVSAGGLSDAITEREPEIVQAAPQNGIPGWVLPAVGLLALAVIASSSGGGGGSSDDDDDDNDNDPPADDVDPPADDVDPPADDSGDAVLGDDK